MDTDRGADGNKKIKGRKEHIIVDTLELPLSINVHEVKVIWLNGLNNKFGWNLEVVLRPKESSKRFNVIPKRWIVERTFSWLENYRRLITDYESLTETAEIMVTIAFIQIAP